MADLRISILAQTAAPEPPPTTGQDDGWAKSPVRFLHWLNAFSGTTPHENSPGDILTYCVLESGEGRGAQVEN
jgi:hypothetical protein